MWVRTYRPDDLDATVRLWYDTWHATFPDLRHPQTFDQFRDRFRDEVAPRNAVWLGTESGRIVALMVLDEVSGYLDQLLSTQRIRVAVLAQR